MHHSALTARKLDASGKWIPARIKEREDDVLTIVKSSAAVDTEIRQTVR